MTKILFTGITGLLGKYFLKAKPEGFKVVGTFNKNSHNLISDSFPLDITNKEEVYSVFSEIKPDLVVHAASIGSVDYCETHKEEAYKVNVEGTKNVIEACSKIRARIIFTSSNAVFDGDNPPYSEDSKINPLDVYGKTKAEGEDLIRKSSVQYVILRLMTMYGWQQQGGRSNPVTWVIDQLKTGKSIKVVNDIFNNHLYAKQAAEIVWKIIESKKNKEVYNIAGGECIDRFNFALKVAKIFDLDSSLITPVPNSYFQNIAPRPKNTCFDTKKAEKDLGLHLYKIEEGLKKMKDEE